MSSHSKMPTVSSKRPTTGSSSRPVPTDEAHQIPEAGLRLEQAQREALEAGAAGHVRRVVAVGVSEPADDRARVHPGVELDPLVVAGDERVDALAVRDLPRAEDEVEVVPSVLSTHCSVLL